MCLWYSLLVLGAHRSSVVDKNGEKNKLEDVSVKYMYVWYVEIYSFPRTQRDTVYVHLTCGTQHLIVSWAILYGSGPARLGLSCVLFLGVLSMHRIVCRNTHNLITLSLVMKVVASCLCIYSV